MIIQRGTTRVVFLVGRYAIKVPRPVTWEMFVRGILANIVERKFSGYSPHLCQVIAGFPGGFVNVMRRTSPVGDDFDELYDILPDEIREMGESKPMNYGMLDGRLVAVDYG